MECITLTLWPFSSFVDRYSPGPHSSASNKPSNTVNSYEIKVHQKHVLPISLFKAKRMERYLLQDVPGGHS